MDLNTQVGDPRYQTTRFGIEIEVENFIAPDRALRFWTLVREASLRNDGIELVSKPLMRTTLNAALLEAEEFVNMAGARATERCGVHAHLQYSHLTWGQLLSSIALHTLVEPHIFAKYAKDRSDNHFCVPMWSNTVLADMLHQDANHLRSGKKPKPKTNMRGGLLYPRRCLEMEGCPKYSALNIKPLFTLGTLEYRYHPGTHHADEIREWLELLYQIQVVAREFDDPMKVVEWAEDTSIITLCEKVGLEPQEVMHIDQEDAIDMATILAGHVPVNWQQLNWEMNECVV
jgi:hypothetical protein